MAIPDLALKPRPPAVDITTQDGVLQRLSELSKGDPVPHASEIKGIWVEWKTRWRKLPPPERFAFHDYVVAIQARLNDAQIQDIFGGVRLALVKTVKPMRVIAELSGGEGLEAPANLDRPVFLPTRPGGGAGYTSGATVPTTLFSQLAAVAGPDIARRIQDGISKGGAAEITSQGDPVAFGRQAATELRTLNKSDPALLLRAMGTTDNPENRKVATQMIDLLQQGKVLEALWLGRGAGSTLSTAMVTNINQLFEAVSFNIPVFTISVGGEKEFFKSDHWTASLDGMLNPSVIKSFKPQLVEGRTGYVLRFEERDSQKLGLSFEMGAKATRKIEEYQNLWLRVAVERPSSALADIQGTLTTNNVIGKLEVGYEDKRGTKVRLLDMPLYYAVRGTVDSLGAVNAQSNIAWAVHDLLGVPTVLAINLDWWAKQSKQYQRYPLLLRFGPQVEFAQRPWGSRYQLAVYGVLGKSGASISETGKLPTARGKIIGAGAEVRFVGNYVRSGSVGLEITGEQIGTSALGQQTGRWLPSGLLNFRLEW